MISATPVDSSFPSSFAPPSLMMSPSMGSLPQSNSFGEFGVGLGTPKRKKKKKLRVVQDIEVIGAEFEEKERLMKEKEERRRRMLPPQPVLPAFQPASKQEEEDESEEAPSSTVTSASISASIAATSNPSTASKDETSSTQIAMAQQQAEQEVAVVEPATTQAEVIGAKQEKEKLTPEQQPSSPVAAPEPVAETTTEEAPVPTEKKATVESKSEPESESESVPEAAPAPTSTPSAESTLSSFAEPAPVTEASTNLTSASTSTRSSRHSSPSKATKPETVEAPAAQPKNTEVEAPVEAVKEVEEAVPTPAVVAHKEDIPAPTLQSSAASTPATSAPPSPSPITPPAEAPAAKPTSEPSQPVESATTTPTPTSPFTPSHDAPAEQQQHQQSAPSSSTDSTPAATPASHASLAAVFVSSPDPSLPSHLLPSDPSDSDSGLHPPFSHGRVASSTFHSVYANDPFTRSEEYQSSDEEADDSIIMDTPNKKEEEKQATKEADTGADAAVLSKATTASPVPSPARTPLLPSRADPVSNFTSPAVNELDLRVLEASTLSGAGADAPEQILAAGHDNLTPVLGATMIRRVEQEEEEEKAVESPVAAVEESAVQPQVHGLLSNQVRKRSTISLPKSNSVVNSLPPPLSITSPSSAASSSTSSARPRSVKSVLLESTDEYDVRVIQLQSSPSGSSKSSPQLRGLSKSGSFSLSSSPSASSHMQQSPLPRPQLGLAVAYMSDYFDASKSGSGVAAESAPPTPALHGQAETPTGAHTPMLSLQARIAAREAKENGTLHSIDGEADAGSPSGDHPSSEGSHIKLLIRPIPRQPAADLMRQQSNLCASCGASIFLGMFHKPRYCQYTGALYCSDCHVKERRPIPGRVLCEGDIKPHKVCKLAAAYIDTIYSIPLIPAAAISPSLFETSRDLKCVFVLRQQLAHIRAFILTCKKKDSLLKLLQQREYMMNDTLRTSGGDASPPAPTAPPPQPSMMAQSVTSDSMPTVAIGSYYPRQSLLGRPESPIHNGAMQQKEMQPSPQASPTLQPAISLSSSPASSPVLSSILTRPSSRSRHASTKDGGVEPDMDNAAGGPDSDMNPTLRDMWSLRDVVETLNGTLYPRLTQVVRQLMAHIVGGRCDLCSSKAFFCEMPSCTDPDTPIYSFQLNTVVQCAACGQSFHRSCFDQNACPKCARLAQRKLQQQQRIIQAKANSQARASSGSFVGSPAFGNMSPLSSPSMAIPTAGGSRGLGFISTGGGSFRGSNDFGRVIDRTRSGSPVSSSPARKLNQRLAGTPRAGGEGPTLGTASPALSRGRSLGGER